MNNKRLIIILSIVAILLLIPFIAMQLTHDVKWSLFDFVVMGVMLLGTGLLFDLILRKVTKVTHRVAFLSIVVMVFILVWAELAVGIFGTPFSGS